MVKGFTFVVNRNHKRYRGKLSIADTLKGLNRGEGILGSCKDYLLNTVSCLNDLDIQDRYLLQLQDKIFEPNETKKKV